MAIYRGESRSFENPLTPNIFRDFYLFATENATILRYQHYSQNKLHTISAMQHSGYPTRLLDWSKCPMVGLFFCCHCQKNLEKDGVFYIFVPNLSINYNPPMKSFDLNNIGIYLDTIECSIDENKHITFWESAYNLFSSHDRQKGVIPWGIPIGVDSLHHNLNPRIIVQKGVHTLHPGYLSLTNNPVQISYQLIPEFITNTYGIREARENHIQKIIIPAKLKPMILDALNNKHKINEETLFPPVAEYFTQPSLANGINMKS